MSAAPERIWVDTSKTMVSYGMTFIRYWTEPNERRDNENIHEYVRSDLALKPVAGEIGELLRHLEGLAAFYKERPSVNQELKCPGMAEISTRECAELYQNLTAASNMISRLSERRGEWQGIGSLVVRAHRDGTWIEFKASNGQSANFRVETLAENKGGIIGSAIKAWCADRQAEVAHACNRCGERVENGVPMEGCRDPDCPEQKS